MRKVLPKKRKIKRGGTPRFLYLLVLLAFAFWAGWGYLLFSVPPDTPTTQIIFLGLLFLALFFTLTFLFYEGSRLIKPEGLPAEALRKGGRRAFLLALFLSFAGGMQLLKIATPVNSALFGLILLLTEVHFSRGQAKPDSRSSPSQKEKAGP